MKRHQAARVIGLLVPGKDVGERAAYRAEAQFIDGALFLNMSITSSTLRRCSSDWSSQENVEGMLIWATLASVLQTPGTGWASAYRPDRGRL